MGGAAHRYAALLMDEMATLLYGLDPRQPVNTADLGGESAICQQRRLLAEEGWLIQAVDALSREWPTLQNRDRARDFLVGALQDADLFTFDGLADVISRSAALDETSTYIVEVLQGIIRSADCRQDMALELWTRLALGGWAGALEVRAALVSRAKHVASLSETVSPYLVRSLGAAFDRWNDDELEERLRLFAEGAERDSDSLMELGFHSLGRAAAAGTLSTALGEMQRAKEWFTRAEQDSGRTDARTFALITRQIHHFGLGNVITQKDVAEVEDCVYSYLSGFVGEEPHWRQPRAGTSASWARLISSLADVADLHQTEWMDAANLIASAADVYAAHRSLALVIDSSSLSEPVFDTRNSQRGVAAILQPQIENGLASASAPIAFIDRWLARKKDHHVTDPESTQLHTVVELRRRLVEIGSDGPKISGVATNFGEEPRVAAMKAAAETSTDAAAFFDEWQHHRTPLNFAQEELLERIIRDIHAYAGGNSSAYDGQMRALVSALIRFVARYLDQLQSGERKVPWLRPEKTDLPGEDVLADSLDDALYFAGLNSKAEIANVGGGRVDVLVEFQRCRFAIEVKRELSHHTNDQLVSKYGAQAVQYAATDVTAVFLAVLDYVERQERLDIEAVFWTKQLQLDPSSRKYALTALRVQAHVESPSVSSRRSGYGRADNRSKTKRI